MVSSSSADSKCSVNWSTRRVFKLLLRAISACPDVTTTAANSSGGSSTAALECMFGTQRVMVAKFPELVFVDGRDFDADDNDDDDTDDDDFMSSDDDNVDDGGDGGNDEKITENQLNSHYGASGRCANLILTLLSHCATKTTTSVRAQVAASLYSLMRQNFDNENVRCIVYHYYGLYAVALKRTYKNVFMTNQHKKYPKKNVIYNLKT